MTRAAVRCLAVLVLIASSACSPPAVPDRKTIQRMIEASAPFQAPIDADIVFLDTRLSDPYLHREVMSVDAVAVKPDGPFGMAGETATIAFTWRFNQGPLAGHKYKSLAKMHGDGGGWKLYEDQLAKGLRVALRGEE